MSRKIEEESFSNPENEQDVGRTISQAKQLKESITIKDFYERKSLISYFYSFFQPDICQTSDQELHLIYHKSYEEIKWYLLFIDLIFVTVVYNTEHFINTCGNFYLNVYFIAISYFAILYDIRNQLLSYSSTYIHIQHGLLPLLQNDLIHRIFIILYGSGIFIMAINITAEKIDKDGQIGTCDMNVNYTYGFAVGFLTCKLLTIVMSSLLLFVSYLPMFRESYYYYYIFKICYSLILSSMISIGMSDYYENMIYLLPLIALFSCLETYIRAIVFNLFRFIDKGMHQQTRNVIIRVKNRIEKDSNTIGEIFIDFTELLERLGIFFVLVLGEGIIGLSFNSPTERTNRIRFTQFCSFLLIACYAIEFFETVDVTTPDRHALRGGATLTTIYSFLTLLISFNLLIAIAGLILLFEYVVDENEVNISHASWPLAFGLFLTKLIMVHLRFIHRFHLRRSVRRGLTFGQKIKIVYSHHFWSHLTSMDIAYILIFMLSAVLHLSIYPICKDYQCTATEIISYHAFLSLILSAVYLTCKTYENSLKIQEYFDFLEKRKQIIERISDDDRHKQSIVKQRQSLLMIKISNIA